MPWSQHDAQAMDQWQALINGDFGGAFGGSVPKHRLAGPPAPEMPNAYEPSRTREPGNQGQSALDSWMGYSPQQSASAMAEERSRKSRPRWMEGMTYPQRTDDQSKMDRADNALLATRLRKNLGTSWGDKLLGLLSREDQSVGDIVADIPKRDDLRREAAAPAVPPGGWSNRYDPKRMGPPGPNEITKQEVASFGSGLKPGDSRNGPEGGGNGGGGMGVAGVASGASKPVADPFKNEQSGIDDMKTLIDAYEKRKRGIDFKPLAALTDAWTGSQLAHSIESPLTDEQHERIVLGLKEKLYQYKGNLDYKRAMMGQLSEQEKTRILERQQDRALKEKLGFGKLGRGADAASDKAASKEAKDETKAKKSAYQMAEKNGALTTISQVVFDTPGADGQYDPTKRSQFKKHSLGVHDRLWEIGREMEKAGEAMPGQGYSMALEHAMSKPSDFKRYLEAMQGAVPVAGGDDG